MNNTALGAENKKEQTINFISEAHEKFYYEKLKEVRYQDVYHKALCYCLGISDDRVIVIGNQKGGVGKTTTTSNLGIGLAKQGKRVLLIDADAQGSLTDYGILKHDEGVDLMPGNIELSGLEVSLVNVMSRELVLRTYIEQQKDRYDYILIDCMPSLGMITINAFASADSILIPVQAAYLPVKGLEQLIKTIGKVKRQINPKLEIEGILLTMVDNRTNYAKDISALVVENYGSSQS